MSSSPSSNSMPPVYSISYLHKDKKLARAPALSLTRREQGKTSVSFAEQRRNEVATVFGDFPLLLVLLVLVLLRVPVYK